MCCYNSFGATWAKELMQFNTSDVTASFGDFYTSVNGFEKLVVDFYITFADDLYKPVDDFYASWKPFVPSVFKLSNNTLIILSKFG